MLGRKDKIRVPLIAEHERGSPQWQKVRKYAEERLELLRRRNDSDMDERKTARLRGSIRELKNLLALDQPVPETEADDIE